MQVIAFLIAFLLDWMLARLITCLITLAHHCVTLAGIVVMGY